MIDIKDRFNKVSKSKTFNRILSTFDLTDKKILDIGCGYGEYLSLFGKGSIGITTTDSEVQYGKEHSLNIVKGNIEDYSVLKSLGTFDAIWANNLFEHLLSPHEFLIQLKTISYSNTDLILGVPVIPKLHFLVKFKWFRGTLASNHISFFTKDTLKYTVEYAGWNVKCIRPFIFSNSILDAIAALFAPHMYVVSTNNTEFRYPPKKVSEWDGEEKYKHLFKITGGK
jgi:SAM-dependent methyltransferase